MPQTVPAVKIEQKKGSLKRAKVESTQRERIEQLGKKETTNNDKQTNSECCGANIFWATFSFFSILSIIYLVFVQPRA